MAEQVIVCPYCRREIPLTEAISYQIREKVLKEVEVESRKREEELARREEALQQREKELKEEVLKRLNVEKAKIEAEAKRQAEERISVEIRDLEERLKEKEQRLEQAQKTELELRKQRREVEERQKALELELVRRLDEERGKIREQVATALAEEHRLKDLENEKKISDMLRQIEDLKRKAEQGPTQRTGEVLEIDLEETLKAHFAMDEIVPVSTGKRGADLLQRVRNPSGQECGTIIWEVKRTKNWSDGWIEKLKEDQREAKAEIAVIATMAMPREMSNFGVLDGVWVTEYSIAPCLATALRMSLIQVAYEKRAAVGKQEKMEALYGYLSGPEFSQKVEAVVKPFLSLKEDLEKEKAAMSKIWAKREKQIERVITNVSRLYGDMQGIIGASLPEIRSLELKNIGENDSTYTEP